MHTVLRQGIALPSVTALQILLNRTRKQNKLHVDGFFGPVTRNAVIDFQLLKKIKPDGVVGRITWPLLTQQSQLKIIDTVDMTDADTMLYVVGNLVAAGADPIIESGKCGGVSVVISQIVARAAQSGSTVLLRMSGHGGPGGQYVSGGRVVWVGKKIEGVTVDKNTKTMKDKSGKVVATLDNGGKWRDKNGQVIALDSRLADETTLTAISLRKNSFVVSPHDRQDTSGVEPTLGKLRDIFVSFGSVELHGCSVGRGQNGRELLGRLSRILGVPVSAALRDQYGEECYPFCFAGPVATAVPFGGNLPGWSKGVATAE